ncbi:MAG: MFS transporter [Chloroflexota bacterium]
MTHNVAKTKTLVTQFPIYYGWVIAVIGSLGLIMTSPAQTYAISIFIEAFITDLNISRSSISTLYGTASLVAGFTLPYIGRQVDKLGSWVVMIIVVTLAGLMCIFMGFVTNIVMLGVGFLGLRILGLGGLTLVSTNVVNQWWVQRRGFVMGIAGAFLSILGLGGFPNLINWLIPQYGWRVTYMILGVMLLVGLLPLCLFFLKDRPEDYGLLPDGREPSEPGVSQSKEDLANQDKDVQATIDPSSEVNWTLAEAIRTPAFWIIAVGISTMAMATTGLFFHLVSIFEDNGLSATIAATVFIPIAVTTAIVSLGSGLLIDRIPARVLLMMALLCQTITLVMAPFLSSVTLAFIYGVIMGITFGLVRIVGGVVWADYYGRRNLGSITGVTGTIMQVGAGLGPIPFGVGRDLLGSYNMALYIVALLPLSLAFGTFFARKPQRQSMEI